MKNNRTVIAALSLSAAALVGLVAHEGYTDEAIIPVKGDVPTNGFGGTVNLDGTRVQLGDKTNPVAALQRSLGHIQKDEAGIKRCVTAPLHQAEYDLLVDFAYQYGTGALCKSEMVRQANAGNYAASCAGYLRYKMVAGYDCSTPGNRRCPGVWKRSQERHAKCMAVQ